MSGAQKQTAKAAPSILSNLAVVESSKAQNHQLPVDIQSDLKEAFAMFDKEQQGAISIA